MSVDSLSQLTRVSVIDGRVTLSNQQGSLTLTNTQAATAAIGGAPQRTPTLSANTLLQWAFYYPGVVDPDELQFSPEASTALERSLSAYRRGDLILALQQLPPGRGATSPDEQLYHAADS